MLKWQNLSTWQTKKPTKKINRKSKEEKISEEEIEYLENDMLALGHDLDRMAWDMSCE